MGATGRDRARARLKPELLRLEDRQLLSTFTVSNTLDTVVNNVPTTGTLRWAVQQADLAGGTGVINFSPTVFSTPQTITLDQLLTPVEMTAAAPNITINGPGAGLLTINGNGKGGVFQVDSGVKATISGLTITGASLGDNGAIDDLGTLSLSNCTLTANTISGVYVAGSATITDCTITANNSFFGAGVYVKGGTANINGCTIDNNTGSRGVGVCNQGTTTVSNCTISGDSALGGGGGLYNAGQLKVYGSTLDGDDGAGAAVYNRSGTAYLAGTTISGSSGFINGGGLNNQNGATLIMTGCTVSGGTAEVGAGLYNDGTATITDCTFSNNTATNSSGGGQGGGIYNGNFVAPALLFLNDSTLAGNTAGFGGGGLYNSGTAELVADTIADNFADQGTSTLASDGGGVDNDGTVTLVACTISGNTTTALGGGVYNGGLGLNQMTLNDTIVAGNTTTFGVGAASDIAISTNKGVPVAGSHDLIGTGGSGGLTNGSEWQHRPDHPHRARPGPAGRLRRADRDHRPAPRQSGPQGRESGTRDQLNGPGDHDRPARLPARYAQPRHRRLPVRLRPDRGRRDDQWPRRPAGRFDLAGAVTLANLLTGPVTITFASSTFATRQTITLVGGPLVLSNTSGEITITGPAAGVTISGGGTSGVFHVDPGVTAAMSGLTITQGSSTVGGGLYNQGTIILTGCTISGNSAHNTGGGLGNASGARRP